MPKIIIIKIIKQFTLFNCKLTRYFYLQQQQSPLRTYSSVELAPKIGLVPILRSGISFVNGMIFSLLASYNLGSKLVIMIGFIKLCKN